MSCATVVRAVGISLLKTNLPVLGSGAEHHNHRDFSLEDHLPEVPARVLERALGNDVQRLLVVALQKDNSKHHQSLDPLRQQSWERIRARQN